MRYEGCSPEGGLVAATVLPILWGTSWTSHVAGRETRGRGVHGLAEVGLRGEGTGLLAGWLALLGVVVVEAHGCKAKAGDVDTEELRVY